MLQRSLVIKGMNCSFLLFVNYCDHAHCLREIRALKPCTLWKAKCTRILPYLYICTCILGFTSTCIWQFWFWAFLLLLFQYWWNKKIKGISSQLCLFIFFFWQFNLRRVCMWSAFEVGIVEWSAEKIFLTGNHDPWRSLKMWYYSWKRVLC